MVPNPCPCMKGMSLQWGVRAVAILEGVVHSLIILSNVLGLVALELAKGKSGIACKCKQIRATTTPTIKPIIIATLVIFIVNIPLAMVLFVGAHKKNALLCWIWIDFTAVSRVVIIINIILIFSGTFGSFMMYVLIGGLELVFIAIEVYFMYVVLVFIKQLRQVDQQQSNVGLEVSAPASAAQLQPRKSAKSEEAEAQQPDPEPET